MQIADLLTRQLMPEIVLEEVSPNLVLSKMNQDALISYDSIVKLTGGKKNPQLGRVVKHVANMPVHIIGPGGYEAAKREAGNADFTAHERKWGTYNSDGLIEHGGNLYVQLIIKGKGQTTYTLDGQPIDKTEIIGLPPSKPIEAGQVSTIAIKLSTITNLQ